MADPQRLPLSAAQQGVWFAHLLDPSQQAFNCAEYIAIDGPVDVSSFRSAWTRVRAEADAVRVSSIVSDHDGLWQVVESSVGADLADLALIDYSGRADPELTARRWMHADLSRPVTMSRPPISTFALLKLAPDRYFFYYRMHHVIVDGYSVKLLGRRLADVYSALALGRPDPGPAFAPLATLIEEDRDYRASAQFERDRDYWMERFADRPVATRLPSQAVSERTDRPLRLAMPSRLTRSEIDGLEKTAALAGVIWQIVLLAAIAAFTRRVTGRTEVILGLPVAGRRSVASRRTPGMATNSVALRLAVDSAESLAELIPQVAAEVRAALRHERHRSEDLRRELGLKEAGRAFIGPMVNFMPDDPALRFGAYPATARNLASGPIVDFSLTVTGQPEADEMDLAFEANPDHHDQRGLLDHRDRLTAFLGAALADPDRPIRRIDPLLPVERRELLVTRNSTSRPQPAKTVPELFAEQAARTPDAIAVSHEGHTWTYAAIDTWANRLALELSGQGLGPEDFAVIRLGRSPELIVAMIAVLYTGAAYAPIDPADPVERIDYVLSDLSPRCVITEVAASAPGGNPAGPAGRADPANPAYVIYTSGSTGTPKAVVVPHSAMSNFVLDHTRRFGLDGASRVLQFVSPSFDVAAGDIWPVLLSGGRLVLAPEARATGAEALLELLAAERVTHAAIPPGMLAQLGAADLPHLTLLITGGEPPAPEVVTRWSPGRRMVNVYGVTEATVATTTSALAPGRPPAIGRPIDNSRVYVLDSDLNPLPSGASGQLFIAGAGLARGYLNSPDLTAERFPPCPYGPPGQRMYATGDLVRWRPDGDLEYHGRIDEQVKVRGFRIEPGEIEAVLAAHPDIRSAIVVVREDRPGRKQLVAFVQPRPGTAPTPLQLRRFAGQTLPEYMVPAAVVMIDAIPLTPNGKIDRLALAASSATPSATPSAAPDAVIDADDEPVPGSREATLCVLFAEVLGVEKVGVHDSFFDLGGDSIAVVPLVSRALAEGIEFPARDVFRHPTVAALAPMIRVPRTTGSGSGSGPGLVSATATAGVRLTAEQRGALRTAYPGMTDVLPVSPLQEGFLFHSLLAGHARDSYTSQMTFDLDGPLDPAAMRAAGEALLLRHPNLRVAFVYDGIPAPVQVVCSDMPLPWAEADLSAVPEDDRDGEARRLAVAERDRGFDLAVPPLLRFLTVKFSGGRHRMVLTAHHILWDGWSTSVLMRELFALYERAALPPVTPYHHYLDWLAGQDREASRRAWAAALTGLPGPTLVSPGAAVADRQEQVRCDLDLSLSAAVIGYARSRGLTQNTLMQAAWAEVLRGLTGLDDVVFGSSVSGRPPELPGIENMVGLLTNTIPVRARPLAGESRPETLARLQAEQSELIPHHYLGLGDIQRQAGIGPNLFDTAIMFVNYSFDPARWAAPLTDLDLTAFGIEDDTHYPLRLAVVPNSRMHLRLGYHPDLFRRVEAERLVGRLIEAVETIISDRPR